MTRQNVIRYIMTRQNVIRYIVTRQNVAEPFQLLRPGMVSSVTMVVALRFDLALVALFVELISVLRIGVILKCIMKGGKQKKVIFFHKCHLHFKISNNY